MIHVLIERQVAEGMSSNYEQVLKTALQQSYVTHGFISGESYSDLDKPNNRYLLCKWRSLQDWQRWARSDERQSLMRLMKPLLTGEEKVTVLQH